ncbi:MAG TPA: hypothetical protein VFR78_11965 [Pyrinomonadaceae bacterium]|nr:hypothetical protein [Pyrinomonadaceae bacterium]
MKKYMLRLSVATLTFLIGTASIYLFAWVKVNPPSLFRATHFSENNSPYSVLEGRTVRLKPYDATFDIPESWLTPHPVPTPAKNLHLSRQDLNDLYWKDGSDAEDAEVINSVLSFSDCAAHVGDRGWGNYLWNDLQGRTYIIDLTPEEIAARIETRGLSKALSVFEEASVTSDNQGAWHKLTLDITDAPTHFILMKRLDFYYRSFGDKTVVFVFLHAGGFDKTINGILSSFKWLNGHISA